jgi:hypothetical protein
MYLLRKKQPANPFNFPAIPRARVLDLPGAPADSDPQTRAIGWYAARLFTLSGIFR